MSRKRKKRRTVVLFPDGEARRQVDPNDIEIPDLWHFAIELSEEERKPVLETWHLAHELKRIVIALVSVKGALNPVGKLSDGELTAAATTCDKLRAHLSSKPLYDKNGAKDILLEKDINALIAAISVLKAQQ